MTRARWVLCCFCLFAGLGSLAWAQDQATPPAGTLHLKKFTYLDREGMGIEAFSFLMPADWQFQGGIKWVLDNPGMPALAALKVTSADRRLEMEVFPNMPFFWTDNQMLLSMFPPGSRYFGMEVMPPAEATDVLHNVVIPRVRPGYQDLTIVDAQPLPDLAKSLAPPQQLPLGVSTSATAAKVRMEYTNGAQPVEEELYGVVEYLSMPIQSLYAYVTNINWTAQYLFSFKAPKGQLEPNAPLFQTMALSFRLNPLWFSKYVQLTEMLIRNQIQHIQSMGELSRYLSQTSNEISDDMMRSYNERQGVYDEISKDFSHNILGIDEYQDPVAGQPVELPSGYDNAWVNGLGEYVLSADPSFNPNVGANQNWQPMNRQ